MLAHTTYARRFNLDWRRRGRGRDGYARREGQNEVKRDGNNTSVTILDEEPSDGDENSAAQTRKIQRGKDRGESNVVPDGTGVSFSDYGLAVVSLRREPRSRRW